jgi:hypothetical protein
MGIDWKKVDAVAGGLTKGELFNEALFVLGGKYVFNGLTIPPPTGGSFVLLEILESPYLKGGDVTDNDIDIAVFVLSLGQDVVGAVFEDKLFDAPIQERITDFINAIPAYDRNMIKVFLATYFKYATNGFQMIPSGEADEKKKMTFDADWLASYVSICNEVTGYDMDKIVWDMPIITGGFCMVRYSRESGEKNVERPEDWKAQLAELRNQIEDGK